MNLDSIKSPFTRTLIEIICTSSSSLRVMAKAGELITLEATMNEAVLTGKSTLADDVLMSSMTRFDETARAIVSYWKELTRPSSRPFTKEIMHDLLCVLEDGVSRLSECVRSMGGDSR